MENIEKRHLLPSLSRYFDKTFRKMFLKQCFICHMILGLLLIFIGCYRNQNAKKKKKKKNANKKKKKTNKKKNKQKKNKLKNHLLRNHMLYEAETYRNINHISCYRFCVFYLTIAEGSGGAYRMGSCPLLSVVWRQHIQTISPRNPLSRLRPNFICSILGLVLPWFIKIYGCLWAVPILALVSIVAHGPLVLFSIRRMKDKCSIQYMNI